MDQAFHRNSETYCDKETHDDRAKPNAQPKQVLRNREIIYDEYGNHKAPPHYGVLPHGLGLPKSR